MRYTENVPQLNFPNVSPLVADVTGDGRLDIIALDYQYIVVLSLTGAVECKIKVPDGGSMPAIGDIDHDGRNDIVYQSQQWFGYDDDRQDTIWAYDVSSGPTGRIEWGQLGGSAKNNAVYPPVP
jgi:hypothetical protein